MAVKRMMAPDLMIDSDLFIEMPGDAQRLYFFLLLSCDDDGFTGNIKGIMRKCNIQEDNLKVLITKKYVIPFESGVIVVRHWKVHNYIKPDRYHPTRYREEAAQLAVINNTYLLIDVEISRNKISESDILLSKILNFLNEKNPEPFCLQNGTREIELDKSSLETTTITTTTSSADSNPYEIPTLEQVKEYIEQINSPVDPERFIRINDMRNWKYKGEPIIWKALIRTWETFEKNLESEKKKKPVPSHDAEVKELFEAYGTLCPSLPKAQRLTADRKKAVSQILNKGYTVEQVKQAFRMAEESPFLRGERKAFHADFDWFFKKDKSGRDNLLKILEGKYTDHSPKQNQNQSAEDYQPNARYSDEFLKSVGAIN